MLATIPCAEEIAPPHRTSVTKRFTSRASTANVPYHGRKTAGEVSKRSGMRGAATEPSRLRGERQSGESSSGRAYLESLGGFLSSALASGAQPLFPSPRAALQMRDLTVCLIANEQKRDTGRQCGRLMGVTDGQTTSQNSNLSARTYASDDRSCTAQCSSARRSRTWPTREKRNSMLRAQTEPLFT